MSQSANCQTGGAFGGAFGGALEGALKGALEGESKMRTEAGPAGQLVWVFSLRGAAAHDNGLAMLAS